MRISERFANVPIIKPADLGSGTDGDSVNMGLLASVAFIVTFGAIGLIVRWLRCVWPAWCRNIPGCCE